MTIKEMYSLAKKKIENNAFEEAIVLLDQILDKYPRSKALFKVYALKGNAYFEISDYEKSIEVFQKSLEAKPDFEIASLGLYLSYVELGLVSNAISELDRFLTKNEPNLYKCTLEELLEGLEFGYATNYEKTIKRIAKKHNVEIMPRSSKSI